MKGNALCDMLGIDYPIIIAPMFLVSNEAMLIEGGNAGLTAAIPALNYRTDDAFRKGIEKIRKGTSKPFGVNLIVNKSNIKLAKQIQTCYDYEVDYIITSLGSPEAVIKKFADKKTKIFCDVVDLKFAKKVEALGADAIIAVNKEAGGHCGPTSYKNLIPELVANCKIPIISAGACGNGFEIAKMLKLGAVGVSMGSIFIATEEAPVSEDYKNACVEYGKDDIVLSSKISGTPCTVINTPYVQKIGTEQNWFEKLLSKNKKLKKYVKMITYAKGMKSVENAAFGATYKTVWCAGPTIEHTKSIRKVSEIANELKRDLEESWD